jgi:hypothetical protein
MLMQPRLIVGTNRADMNSGAVEHRRVDGIFVRVARHVVITHRTVFRVYRDFAWNLARI